MKFLPGEEGPRIVSRATWGPAMPRALTDNSASLRCAGRTGRKDFGVRTAGARFYRSARRPTKSFSEVWPSLLLLFHLSTTPIVRTSVHSIDRTEHSSAYLAQHYITADRFPCSSRTSPRLCIESDNGAVNIHERLFSILFTSHQ